MEGASLQTLRRSPELHSCARGRNATEHNRRRRGRQPLRRQLRVRAALLVRECFCPLPGSPRRAIWRSTEMSGAAARCLVCASHLGVKESQQFQSRNPASRNRPACAAASAEGSADKGATPALGRWRRVRVRCGRCKTESERRRRRGGWREREREYGDGSESRTRGRGKNKTEKNGRNTKKRAGSGREEREAGGKGWVSKLGTASEAVRVRFVSPFFSVSSYH